MRCVLATLTLCFFSVTAHAANIQIYSCPNTYKSVRIGDSMDTLRAACGNPTTTSTQQQQIVTPQQTVQWVYTLGLLKKGGYALVLPSLTITFNNNQVTSIAKSGLPIATTNGYCAINGIVNLGDSTEKVLLTCGQPSYINSSQSGVTSNKTVTVWTFNYGPYQPQVIFTFDDNNKIIQITTGQLGN